MKYTAAILSFASTALAQGCAQYSSWSGNGYQLNNNLWGESSGSGSQCIYLGSSSSGGVSWHTTWQWSGGSNSVKSYAYSGINVTPKLMSQVNSMPTSVSWSYNTTNGINADVSYDQFTAADKNHVTYSGDYELMVWLAKLGNIQPIGSVVRSGVSLAGHTWDLWSGGGSQHTYSFVATSTTNSFSGDLMVFWKYLQQNFGYPLSSQYVLNDQFGTEAFTGGPANFQVNQWSASIN